MTSNAQVKGLTAREPAQATVSNQLRKFTLASMLTLFALMILTAYLSPFGYMTATSLKDMEMISNPNAPLLPSEQASFEYEGKKLGFFTFPPKRAFRNWR